MTRLLRIGGGIFLCSIIPIVSWLLIGISLNDPNLNNVFSLTYPIQFIYGLLLSIFATGANIKAEKENNKNAVLSGMTLGLIVGGLVCGVLLLVIDQYITFMSMEIARYKTLAIYSIIQQFINLVFNFVIIKLDFENKDKLGFIHSLIFNFLSFFTFIGTSYITKNQSIIVLVSLLSTGIYCFGLLISQYRKFKLEFNILHNIKYESASIVGSLFMFATYFFGFQNAFSQGEEYIKAINFETLITDSQWDAFTSIETVAKIDVAKGEYNHKKSVANAFLYTTILMVSSLIMFEALYRFYKLNLTIVLIFFAIDVFVFYISSLTESFQVYFQINQSAIANTSISLGGHAVRFVFSSFLPTPYCTGIAMLIDNVLQTFIHFFLRFKYYKVNRDGFLVRKLKIQN